MGYIKTLAIMEQNQEFVCPFCKVVMKLNKKCRFECPICSLEIVINKKVIDNIKYWSYKL